MQNLFSKAGKFNERVHAESRSRHLISFNCYLTGISQSGNVSAIAFLKLSQLCVRGEWKEKREEIWIGILMKSKCVSRSFENAF